ncbi:hypothetical protein [Streptomyces rubellomurinus]|uniref:Uncharacterized protein n=1 Tax=Streptomyces sp. Y1 TaxID=3238634 RepID=A0AB39TLD5_9ACTN|nr:hypothetical protein [Streptomyces rubellomurinus]
MSCMRRFVRKVMLSLAIAAVLGTGYLAEVHESDRAATTAARAAVADDFNWN